MTRKRRATKVELLQAQWDEGDKLMEGEIVFRPFDGWYVVPDEARHFYDEGDFIGTNYQEAKAEIEWLRADC